MITSTTTSKNANPIGFFDSGVGGLTVYSKFRAKLKAENCLYFGDTVHLPYGNKTKYELISYARYIMDFYKTQDVKAVVIACNTSSSAAYDTIKDEYDFKIYPIIQCCAKILSELPINRLGIFATHATISSGVYESEIKKYNKNIQIFSQSCPNWVNIVESNSQDTPEDMKIIYSDLNQMLINNPEKIVLGCTHYPYLLKTLSNFAPVETFIDPADYFVNYIVNDLSNSNLLNQSSSIGYEKIYVSANPQQFQNAAEMFYKVNKLPQLV
ncbi:MAG: glutamate racemase [Candidatus Gastranaerophilaceae bacterium]